MLAQLRASVAGAEAAIARTQASLELAELDVRRAEIPKAEIIVEQELEQFGAWRASLAATPLIKAIREARKA